MKKIFLVLLLITLSIPVVLADSGLDASYDSSNSLVGSLMSGSTSGLSVMGELVSASPNDADYIEYRIVLAIFTLLIIYIFSCIQINKINRRKTKKILTSILFSLIPTIIYSLFIFLFKLPLILYMLVLIIYIIITLIIIKINVKKRLQKQLDKVYSLDKKFDLEKFNIEAFNIYKDIQISWMNFKLDDVKKLLSEDIYNKYSEKLKKLKEDKQKNIMDNIKYKKNKITNIEIENNNVIIECIMDITCNDYIINNEEKIVKGKKDKICKYKYKLVFSKNIKTNEYVLIEKKMKEQK